VGATVIAPTVTAAVAGALVPPGPLQVKEKEVFALSAAEFWVPLVARGPLQPPDAAHEVALVELHVSADVPPLATAVGLAVRVAVGTGAIVTVAVAG
jgi:hypothetical protein